MKKQEKRELLQLISNGKTQKAIDLLLGLELNETRKKEAYSISSQYKRLKQQGRLGVLASEHEKVTENQIVARFIDLVEHIDDPTWSLEPAQETPPPAAPSKNKNIIYGLGALASIVLIFALVSFFTSTDGPLQLTVLVSDADGKVIVENEGELSVDFGNDRRTAMIGENGRTNFGEIPAKFKDSLITIGFDVEGYEITGGKNSFKFSGNPIRLTVQKDNSLGIIKGVVKSQDGQEFLEGVSIRINNDTIIKTNEYGIYNIVLPEHMRVEKPTDTYLLTVSKEGYKTRTEYFNPNSGDTEFRLIK